MNFHQIQKLFFSAMKITNKSTLTKSHFDPTGSDFTWGASLATGGNDANLSNTSLRDAMKAQEQCVCIFNGIVYQGNNNVDGNCSVVVNKVEKSKKFLVLNLNSPFNVYGFRS